MITKITHYVVEGSTKMLYMAIKFSNRFHNLAHLLG